MAGILRAALATEPMDAEGVVWSIGDETWLGRAKATAAMPAMIAPPARIRLAPPSRALTRGQTTAAPSAHQVVTLARELRLPNVESRERGAAIHLLLEQIEWLEDFAATDAELLSLLRARFPRRDEAWARRQIESFRAMLGDQSIIESLSVGAADRVRVNVYREYPFARLANGQLQTGFIDRLVTRLDTTGRPCHATIIDFKTDAAKPAHTPALVEHYRPQLESYRAIVMEHFGLPSASIELLLLFVAAPNVFAATL
jgi:hypothetical protein